MNIQKFALTAAFVATTAAIAGSAFAETRYPVDAPFVSTKTRAQVIAEINPAGNEARLNYLQTMSPTTPQIASTKTRAQVIAELDPAGNAARVNYSNNTRAYPTTTAFVSTKTRAEVRAQLANADTSNEQGLTRGY